MSKLFEIGVALGAEHAQDRERFRAHWDVHVRNSRRMLLEGAGRVASPESVTILGGGSAYNLPLEELARQFDHVRLIDIDADNLQKAISALPAECRAKVEIHVADVSGGLATDLVGRALEVIEKAHSSEQAAGDLVPLFGGREFEDGGSIPNSDWKASYVISSCVSSQLTIFPEKAVMKAFNEKFDAELEDDFFLKNGSSRLRTDWVRRHGELLSSLVTDGGRVYWADTVAETPCLEEFGPEALSVMVDVVVSFLDRAYLKTFFTEAGKQVLADRLNQGNEKRRFAWAVMTLVGENYIAPNRELELVTWIIREAERMFPNARQPILEGGKLSQYFPASLMPEGEPASWLWINDPEGAVTLEGYSYYVDASILRRTEGL